MVTVIVASMFWREWSILCLRTLKHLPQAYMLISVKEEKKKKPNTKTKTKTQVCVTMLSSCGTVFQTQSFWPVRQAFYQWSISQARPFSFEDGEVRRWKGFVMLLFRRGCIPWRTIAFEILLEWEIPIMFELWYFWIITRMDRTLEQSNCAWGQLVVCLGVMYTKDLGQVGVKISTLPFTCLLDQCTRSHFSQL